MFLLGLSFASSAPWARTHHKSNSPTAKTSLAGQSAKATRSSTHRSSRYTSSRHRSRRGRHSKAIAHRSYGQQAPTAERYQQIQQALAAKGYFKGQVNGAWGPDSVDALKRFQTDQNLTVDGKIGSLSLIALGLGPKRNLSAQVTQPAGATTPPKQPEVTNAPAAPIPQ